MPDKDIFDFEFGKRWRSLAREISRGIKPEIVANKVVKSLINYSAEMNLSLDILELYSILIEIDTFTDIDDKKKLFIKLGTFERNSRNRDISNILTKTCKQICIDIEMKNDNVWQMNLFNNNNISFKEFVIRCFNNILEHEFNGKVNFFFENKQKSSWNNSNYQNSYYQILNNYIEQFAEKLTRDPFLSKQIRVKRIKEKRKSTEEVLHLPIESI